MLQFETEMIRQLRPYAIHDMRQFSPVIIGIQKTINTCIEWRLNINFGLKWLRWSDQDTVDNQRQYEGVIQD